MDIYPFLIALIVGSGILEFMLCKIVRKNLWTCLPVVSALIITIWSVAAMLWGAPFPKLFRQSGSFFRIPDYIIVLFFFAPVTVGFLLGWVIWKLKNRK